jgi:hypothetical protein
VFLFELSLRAAQRRSNLCIPRDCHAPAAPAGPRRRSEMSKQPLPKTYDFKSTEGRIYERWERGG